MDIDRNMDAGLAPGPVGEAPGFFTPGEGLMQRTRNVLWATLGFLSLGLGIVGAFLPVLPTTIFLIIATWAFAESCPAARQWVLDHPRFGASVRLWFDHGVIPLKAKRLALGLITASYAFTAWVVSSMIVVLGVGAVLLAVSIFIVSRPENS